MRKNPNSIKEEDFEDELEDQLAESLFQEADQMGIFKKGVEQAVDYTKALKTVQQKISEVNQIDSGGQQEKSKSYDSDSNEDLYNQAIDDNGNTLNNQKPAKKLSAYETEYNEVIMEMSTVCRHLVYNNNPQNKEKKLKMEDETIEELCPRIWALSVEWQYQSEEDQHNCFIQTLLKGSFGLLGVKSPQ